MLWPSSRRECSERSAADPLISSSVWTLSRPTTLAGSDSCWLPRQPGFHIYLESKFHQLHHTCTLVRYTLFRLSNSHQVICATPCSAYLRQPMRRRSTLLSTLGDAVLCTNFRNRRDDEGFEERSPQDCVKAYGRRMIS